MIRGPSFSNPPNPHKKKRVMHSSISCLNYNLHISSLPMPSTIIRLRLCIWSAMQIDNYIAQFCKYLRKETCEKVLKVNWLKILSWAKVQLLAWKFKWLERQRDRIGINEVAMLLLHVPPFKLQVLSAFYYLHSINTIIIDMNGLQITDDYMHSKAYSNKLFILKVFIPIRSNNKNIDDWWSFMI